MVYEPAMHTQMSNDPEANKITEYAAFDVLRFVLAATVLLNHIGVLGWDQTGNLAVQVFFALSGWLIGGILYNTDRTELCGFYFNRSTRVWVPYFFTVSILYFTSFVHDEVRSSRWVEFLIYDVTFTHNWFTLWPNVKLALLQMPLFGTGNHFWSLAVEEQFYLVAPLIMTVLPFGRKVIPWAGIAVLSYVSGSQYAAISFGVLSAVITKKWGNWYLRRWGSAAVLIAATATLAVLHIQRFYNFAAPAFAIGVVLLCARPMKRTAITRWLGGISFPLYLNAWMGIFAWHAIDRHLGISTNWLSRSMESVAGVGAGILTYLIVDRPVLAYRHRYYNRTVGWTLGGAGYVLVISGVVFWICVWG